MQTEWWVELRVEVTSELPSPELSLGLNWESGREQVGKRMAWTGRERSGATSFGRHRDSRGTPDRDMGWIQRSDDRGECFRKRAHVLLKSQTSDWDCRLTRVEAETRRARIGYEVPSGTGVRFVSAVSGGRPALTRPRAFSQPWSCARRGQRREGPRSPRTTTADRHS